MVIERDSSVDTNRILRIESGVDWITVTGKGNRAWERVQGMAQALWSDETARGEKHRHESRHGFSMSCAGGVQYGSGKDGWMVVLTSGMARKHWMAFAAYGDKVTRIDLQATIWHENDTEGMIEAIHGKAWEEGNKATRNAMTIILNGKKGDTLYYGSRSTAQFGRIYDKWRQQKFSPPFKYALRYEVEFKKPLSGEVVRWMLDENPTDDQIAARVFQWFHNRQISVPQICTIPNDAIQYPQEVTPIERKLEWLRKTVRPVYRQLVALGFQIEADGSIGVSDDAITIQPIETE